MSEVTSILEYESTYTITELDTIETLLEITDVKIFFVEGYIDLSNVTSDITITIYEDIKIHETGEYKTLNEQVITYDMIKDKPLVRFTSKLAKYGYRIQIIQSGGSPISIPYYFAKFEVG